MLVERYSVNIALSSEEVELHSCVKATSEVLGILPL